MAIPMGKDDKVLKRGTPVLGLLGLPGRLQGLSAQGLYRLGVDDPSLVTGCLLGCVMANTARNIPLACVFDPGFAPVVHALRNERKRLGTREKEMIFQIRIGAEERAHPLLHIDSLLRQLGEAGLEPGGLILIAGLQVLLPQGSERRYAWSIRRLHAGLRKRAWTALSVEHVASTGQRNRILRSTQVAGAGMISLGEDEAVLRRSYWRGVRRGSLDPVQLQLTPHALQWKDTDVKLTSVLGGRVIAQESTWPDEVPRPDQWQFFANPTDVLRQAAVTVLPICILAYDRHSSFEMLARYVHALRLRTGPSAGIFVREVKRQLRSTEQMILARVGMNAVLPEDTASEAMCRLIEEARGQDYAFDVAVEFDAAMTAAAGKQSFGYLSPRAFVDTARLLIRQGRRFGIGASMVYLPLRPDSGHLQVLEQLKLVRHGDIATVDDRAVYLYLHGCLTADVDKVLKRSFSVPLDQLFDGHVSWSSAADIDAALAHLHRFDLSGAVMDYGAILSAGSARDAKPELHEAGKPELAAVLAQDGPVVKQPRRAARALHAWAQGGG